MRAECLAQSHGSCGLAFAKRSGGNRGHIDILTVRTFCQPFEDLQLDLGFVGAEQLQFVLTDPKLSRNLQDELELSRLRDLNIRRYRTQEFKLSRCKRSFLSVCGQCRPHF